MGLAQRRVVAQATPMVPTRLFALVAGATLLTSINYSLVFVAFGDIGETFASQPTLVSWALTGFSIAAAAFLVPAGWMADRFGRERVFLAGLALFTLGSALVATAPTVGVLLGGRVVQAIGLVLESSAALPLLLDAFSPSRRATIVGSLGATGGAAAAMGPVIGGALVQTVGWRWTFALNVPIGIALSLIVLVRLPLPAPTVAPAPPDIGGVAALALGMGALVLAITQVDDWGVTDVRTVTAMVVAALFGALVLRRSQRHPEPVLHLPLLRDPSYRRGVLLNVLIAGTFSGAFFSFIQLLTKGWGLSTFEAGLAVAVIPLFGGPLSFVAGRIADRRGPRAVIVPGALLMAAAGFSFAVLASDERQLVMLWLPVAVVYGIGVGLAHAACHAAALRTVPRERLGIGGAMSRMGMDLGGVITVAIAVALVSSATDTVAGVRQVMVLVSAACLVGAVLASGLPTPRSVDLSCAA